MWTNANQNMSTFFFPRESIACCNSTKWQWSGIEQMILHTVYHFHYFSGPLNCPMFYLKGSSTFTLIHRNLVYFLHSIVSELNPLSSHLASSDSTWCSACCFAVRRRPGLAVAFLWSSIEGYQHNTRLNMLEHIPSNPEHTVIRGHWASYHSDHTNTCHWSAELCKGVWGCGRGEWLGRGGSWGFRALKNWRTFCGGRQKRRGEDIMKHQQLNKIRG